MSRHPLRGVAFALLCLLILGTMPVLSNARPAGSDALAFAIWATAWQLLAALPLFLVERARRGPIGESATAPAMGRVRIALIALATGAMFGLSTYLYVLSAEKAGPVSMVIALQAYPFVAMSLEALFLGKRRSRAEIGFTLLMVTALLYLTTEGRFSLSAVSWWTVLALTIPLLWSIAHLLLKRVLDTTRVTPNQVTVSRLVISGAFLLLLQALLGESGRLSEAWSEPGFQRAAIILGVAYYLELIFWFHAMRHIDVSVASSITVPAPVVTMLLAAIVLGQAIAAYQVVAMLVVAASLYGLLMAGRLRRPAALPKPAPAGR